MQDAGLLFLYRAGGICQKEPEAAAKTFGDAHEREGSVGGRRGQLSGPHRLLGGPWAQP